MARSVPALGGTATASPRRVSWLAFRDHLRRSWAPGQHVSIFAPTGKGKTVLAVRGLLPMREHVLTLDAKGADPELERRTGPKRDRYPRWWELGDQANRFRLQPAPDKARGVFGEALGRVYRDGGWTVYLDEARLITDYYRLSPQVHKLWLFARSRKVSVVAGTQAPRWVPSAMYDQATHLFIGRVRDRRVVTRLAELVSDVPGVRDLLPRLGDHDFLYVGPELSAIVSYPLRSGS